ncbi:phage tail protein [Neisseria sicca]|jgi:putative tail fiber protein|uniref:Phage tail protein n=1 Tax=Neisseria sicca TaxID=490 RepID=A0A2I1XBM6_NEISI|nr:phage tail protein [Neisseria sicca]PLA40005.1 phage tail protein [Neisseria sicca]
MANLSEMSRWEAGIYQWETSDPVQGGPNGIDNRPTRELANRTRWLYDELGRVKARMDDPNFYKSITVSDSKALFDANNYLHIGADAAGGYIRNKKTNKGIQLKNDGTLQYDGSDIITARKVSHNPGDYTVATVPSSFALNKAFDNSIKRGGAIGLGGAAHQIAIGWDTPGLVAKVDTQTFNVGVPTGAIAYFVHAVVPFGWLKANGAAVSRTVYANLFALIGTTYGAGDGRTTFNLPDLRGEFLRSWDDGRGIDSGRVLGSAQSDAIRNITGEIGLLQRTDINEYVAPSGAFRELRKVSGYIGRGGVDDWLTITNFSASNVVPTAAENRPRNIALLACIKA